MERAAIFVDVGYLLAASGDAFLGTSYRPYIRCDYPGLVGALVGEVERDSMATAYLLGGDEDVREGVAAAQDISDIWWV